MRTSGVRNRNEETDHAGFSLDELDERFNAMDDAANEGYLPTGDDAFERFSHSGFRGIHAQNGLSIEEDQTQLYVAEPPTSSSGADAERPEEIEFARAVEAHLDNDVFALLRRFEAICSAR